MSVILVTICLIVGIVYISLQDPLYKSSSKIAVSGRTGSVSANRETELNNIVELMRSQRVINDTAIKLGIDGQTLSEIRQTLNVTNTRGTEIITIELATSSADTSHAFLEGIIASLPQSITDIYGSRDNTIQLNIIDHPDKAISPYNYNPLSTYLLATLLGLAISFVVAFIRYDIRNNSKNVSYDTERLERAQLAARISAAQAEKLAYEAHIAKIKAEQGAHKAAYRISQQASIQAAKIKAAADLRVAKRDAKVYETTSRKVTASISHHKIKEASEGKIPVDHPLTIEAPRTLGASTNV
jgi:capsular polysaccharide biosynthesis protein